MQTSVAPEKKLRSFQERHLTVPRSARYAIMGSLDSDLSEVWIVCHGHGQLAARFLSRFLPLERVDRLFVAPEGLSRYYLSAPRAAPHAPNAPVGASWMTAEDREFEIRDYVSYLDLLHQEIFSVVDRAKVRLHVLGFSQGVATVIRWVVRGRAEPDRVILCAGFLPPELDGVSAIPLAARSPLTLAFGNNDEFAKPELIAAQEARLRQLGISYVMMRFDGAHEITPELLIRLASEQKS